LETSLFLKKILDKIPFIINTNHEIISAETSSDLGAQYHAGSKSLPVKE